MSRVPPEDRPTANQLKALSNGSDPWACRMCGCKDWRVAHNRHQRSPGKRERECRNCGEPMETTEVPTPPGFKVVVVPEDEEDEVAA